VPLRVVCDRAATWRKVLALADDAPLGVWLDGVDGRCAVLTVESTGVLWCVAGGEAKRTDLVRWCLEHRLRVYPGLVVMLRGMYRGESVGFVPEHLPGFAVRLNAGLAGWCVFAEDSP